MFVSAWSKFAISQLALLYTVYVLGVNIDKKSPVDNLRLFKPERISMRPTDPDCRRGLYFMLVFYSQRHAI
jgi:hypothetical protein